MLASPPSRPSSSIGLSTPRKPSATGLLPTSSSSSSQNPLSIRLYKVLAANFDDETSRDALNTLAELYGPSTNKYVKGKEVRRTEDDTFEEDGKKENGVIVVGAGGLGEVIPGDIAAKARKNLKRDVEKKLSDSSRRFLNAFSEVDKQLDTLHEYLNAMRTRCDEAQAQLHETSEACRSLLDRAGSLREQRQEIVTRQSIVNLFLDRFTLSAEEVEAITSRDVHIGARFFRAMNKAERIRNDCRVLMAGEDGPTKAGVDIMTATSSYLEQAYEKIFRWCSFEFRQMGRDAQLEVPHSMEEAVRRLQERPELLNEALSYLSQTRQATLLSGFTDALTRGGPGGLPRPIELHAHDPMRYVGDMLAWVHQAIAAEREFLEALFGVKSDGRMVGSIRTFEKNDREEWMSELMDAAVGKLSNPLKVRIQQTVRSQESSITLYKIANLLQFYSLTMKRTIGDNAVLSKTLQDMTVMAYQVFFGAIETQGRSLTRLPLDIDDPSLTPPLPILDHAQVLREIMLVYQSSMMEEGDSEAQNEGFSDILDKMVDPAIEMCMAASEEKAKLRPDWDRSVFILNTLTYLQSVLEPFSFTLEKLGLLQGLVEGKVIQLIEEHYASILKDTGLGEIIDVWNTRRPNEPLSRLPEASPTRIQSTLHRFSLWLSSLNVDHSPRLQQLTVQSLATRIHQAALERLIKTYKWFCEEIRNPENKYEAGATLLASERPFGQVRLLWQIFGIEEKEEDEKIEEQDEAESDEDGEGEEEDEEKEEEEEEEEESGDEEGEEEGVGNDKTHNTQS